jgi:acetyl esterase/lipase
MKTEIVYLSEDKVASIKACLFEAPPAGEQGWTPTMRPAVLVVPGGAYLFCSAREGDPVAVTFNQAGYQTFVLNYHVGEASAYPAPLVEIAQALAHIRSHSEEYGIDPDRIAVIGFSAGGHLAALLGSSWHQETLQELAGLRAEEMKPNAVLLGYPVVNLRARVERSRKSHANLHPLGAMLREYALAADPLALVSDLTPPTYLFHTGEDDVLLPIETIEYVKALLAHDVPCEYHLFSKGQHGLSTADSLSCYGWDYPERVHHWVPMAIAWLNELFQFGF